MDRVWMRQKLEAYKRVLDQFIGLSTPWATPQGDALVAELHRQEPTVREILRRLDPSLADFNLDAFGGKHASPSGVLTCIHQGLGILADQDDWAVKLAPDAPALYADRFHPWVWAAAQTFWDSGHYRKAVDVAANAVNAHTQAKVGRHDIFDTDLMNQVFTDRPKPGQAYLQIPGDQADQTIRSRNRALRPFAEGCFAGLRNPAVHEHGPDWDEQEALEYLAALSILARWIDECIIQHGT
jgi:uncharacterized protein (TIGR02391 family)